MNALARVLASACTEGYTQQRPGFTLLMLTGSELIAKVKECGDMNKSDLVRECGYVKGDKLCFTQFYEALLEAKGFEMKPAAKRGRSLTYKTKVQFNGKLSIGEGYVQEMGFKPGDEFEIKLGRKSVTLSAANQTAVAA
jgi:hypothetical protein